MTDIEMGKIFDAKLLSKKASRQRRTLDLSGNGLYRLGRRPHYITMGDGTTVIAIVISSPSDAQYNIGQTEILELSQYFQFRVIEGPNAFVETAVGFSNFEIAMVRQLKRESGGLSPVTGPDFIRLHYNRSKLERARRTSNFFR